MTTIQDITIRQGSRYRAVVDVQIEWLPTLAGYTARGAVRRSRTMPGDILADLTPYLTVDEPNHLVTIDIPADVSAAWDWRYGDYDLEVHDSTAENDVRFMQGHITVNLEVTH